jgi:cobyrinic acid a,c-diamide synthase
LGILRALARAGRRPVSAKVGPDYIDPRFHEAASHRACRNLDGWAMRSDYIQALVNTAGRGADLCIIEGVMGLFDGSESGAGSTADLAAALGLPILFVLDVRTQGQSAAALVHGFASYRSDCHLAGVILNRVGSPRHARMIETALAPLSIPVVGAIPNIKVLDVPSRHLGLVQAGEHPDLESFLERAADLVDEHVDMERLDAIAAPFGARASNAQGLPPLAQSIAVAGDAAFGFAYPHLLESWRAGGAEIRPFSPLADEAPPDADAIFLPGGYPELHAARLAANHSFLDGLRTAAANGALIYGECGGYMVLGEAITDAAGETHPMAGLLPVHTSFAERKLHLGYRRLVHDGALPFPPALRGHEFHYSTIAAEGEADPLFHATDSTDRDLGAAGQRRGRVMGSYAHIIDMDAAP